VLGLLLLEDIGLVEQGHAELEALAREGLVEVVGAIELGLLPLDRLLGAPLLMRPRRPAAPLGLGLERPRHIRRQRRMPTRAIPDLVLHHRLERARRRRRRGGFGRGSRCWG
jgi:hypothetical protein